MEKNQILSIEEIDRLLNQKETIADRPATEADLRIIRNGLVALKSEHERRSNFELAYEVEKLILQMDFMQLSVRENDNKSTLFVTFVEQVDENRTHSWWMSFPLK
ncbi:MAG TPA: hypothetical protein GX497_08740 [Bacillus bacterium]|nr:hypothetical protein [Bacillus sp. (in: firmicutes)]